MLLQGKKLNFIGDSITEGVGVEREENRYVDRIAAVTGAICRNYGISGTRIARQKVPSDEPRFDLDFCSRYEEMDPDADAVIVFGGTNDCGHGDAPLGSRGDRTADTFYGALYVLYSGLLARYPGKPIVVLTPLPRSNEWDFDPPLSLYVQIIREVAAEFGLPVLDLYATSPLRTEDPAIVEAYVPDGLHPNDAGHRYLAEQIGEYLYNLLENS